MFLQILKKIPKTNNSNLLNINSITKLNFTQLNKSSIFYNSKISIRNFCSTEKKEQAEKSEVKRELEETEEEKTKRLEREEKIRKLSEKYTEEEFKILIEKEEEIEFMEIKPELKRKLIKAKKICLLLNIPLAIAIVFLIDKFFDTEKDKSSKLARFVTLAFGYNMFFVAFTILVGYRNITLMAKYLPKEKAVEFTKLSALCKPYKVKENAENLKRMKPGMLTPHISLKNSRYNNIYSMNGIAEWKDRKLFNTLFPPVIAKKEKMKKIIKMF
jgi:hypothetical protein